MTYRGIYRDGVIVPEESLSLPEGSRVDFDILKARSETTKKVARGLSSGVSKKRRVAPNAGDRVEAFMKARGIMRGHAPWKGKSSASIASELRKQAMGDRFRG